MAATPTSSVSVELLGDFYSECEEHLGIIRESISLLERGTLQSDGDSVLQRLFRSFHTLKANSAIIGLRDAEQLAHAIEDFLRPLSSEQSVPTARVVNHLMEGTQHFEEIIGAHRAQKPAPDFRSFIQELEQSNESGASSSEPEAEPAKDLESRLRAFSGKGLKIWKVSFTPSAELD